MRLWRLTRPDHTALDGAGGALHGGRYFSSGRAIVSLASEPGLAVLVALRYAMASADSFDEAYVLGWTEVDARPISVPAGLNAQDTIAWVDAWYDAGQSLLAAIPSAVLPEADVVLLNARHPDAAQVPALSCRAFSFAQCLHRPPMLDAYRTAQRDPGA